MIKSNLVKAAEELTKINVTRQQEEHALKVIEDLRKLGIGPFTAEQAELELTLRERNKGHKDSDLRIMSNGNIDMAAYEYSKYLRSKGFTSEQIDTILHDPYAKAHHEKSLRYIESLLKMSPKILTKEEVEREIGAIMESNLYIKEDNLHNSLILKSLKEEPKGVVEEQAEHIKKVMSLESDNLTRFKRITAEMSAIYASKNRDYGNSFDISLDEDGLLVAKIRLGDKYNRFSQLIKNDAQVKSESKRDTLLDMANYAIMTAMWMDAKEEMERLSKEFIGDHEVKHVLYADDKAVELD